MNGDILTAISSSSSPEIWREINNALLEDSGKYSVNRRFRE